MNFIIHKSTYENCQLFLKIKKEAQYISVMD